VLGSLLELHAVLRKVSGYLNSGGVSSPRVAATGSMWVHALPQEIPGSRGIWSGFLPLFPSLLAVKAIVTCNNKNAHNN